MSLFCIEKLVIYIYCSGMITTIKLNYLNLYWYVYSPYNGVWIDMLMYFAQYNYWLYFILGILSYISHMYGLVYHCIVVTFTIVLICLWMLYICLPWYVGVLHIICSLVALNIEKLVMHITYIWFLCHFRHPHWPEFKEWIYISFFELVVTCIEMYILVL